uniref:Uncharacterized protein n=1 Tax=Schlesneria paludicola TaxID=360056 RepID=A0A7C2JYZ7_9PLAN
MIRVRFTAARLLACGLVVAAAPLAAQEQEPAGMVRISKSSEPTVRAQGEALSPANCVAAPAAITHTAGNCPECNGLYIGGYAPNRTDWRTTDWTGYPFHQRTQAHSLAMESWMANHCHHCPGLYYHDATGQDMINYFRCKFGYFIPTGNGGAGTPHFGKYARVYPVDPGYFDQRDGQLWGAQGYGTPVAVPLAPTVAHQWNYSWGTPASRLTPVSRIAPY